MNGESTDSSANGAFVRVPTGGIAIAAILVAIAALTTLVIIVSLSRVDLLSVVALALAVLAFAAQLIIYIVQSSQSSADSRRALELHAQLQALLSELRERTGSTQRSVETINGRLLEAVIGKARVEGDSTNFARQVAETYVQAAEDGGREVVSSYPPLAPEVAASIHRELLTWPTEAEVPETLEILQEAPTFARLALITYAKDLLQTTAPNVALGPGLRNPSKDLRRLGLIEQRAPYDIWMLSEKGRKVGRIFVAPEPAPPYLGELGKLRTTAMRLDEELYPASYASTSQDEEDEGR